MRSCQSSGSGSSGSGPRGAEIESLAGAPVLRALQMNSSQSLESELTAAPSAIQFSVSPSPSLATGTGTNPEPPKDNEHSSPEI